MIETYQRLLKGRTTGVVHPQALSRQLGDPPKQNQSLHGFAEPRVRWL